MSLGPPEPSRVDPGARAVWLAGLFAVVVGAVLLRAVFDVPFLSEDWTHLAAAREQSSLLAALDPRLEPLRPFQHAFFWILAHCGLGWTDRELPALARVFAFALHGASCALVYVLAREIGLSKRGSAIALALFVAFPDVRSLAWPAAIGSPGRVACELASLACFVRWTRTASRASGGLSLLCFALALGFHESAMLLPAFFALWIVLMGEGGTWDGIAHLVSKLRQRTFAVACTVGVVYVVYLACLRPQRHHGWKSFDALPANAVKAALALVPSALREPAVEGLRGHTGALGWVVGGVALVAVASLFAWSLWRSPLARFLAIAIAIELALPVIGTGFAQRYAYLAAALLSIGLAAWSVRAPSFARGAAIVLLGAFWLVDSASDAHDVAEAGACARLVIESARAERAKVPAQDAIAVIDLPDMMGRARDLPVFNWGADILFAQSGLGERWLYWRTREFATTTNVERVDTDRIQAAARNGQPHLLVYVPGVGLQSTAGVALRK